MNAGMRKMLARYSAALRDYVADPDEAILERIYQLVRQAIGDERFMLELVAAYHQELLALIRAAPTPDARDRAIGLAQAFLVESLSPFAMAQRGFRDTVARLHALQLLLEFQQAISDAPLAQLAARIVTHAARPLGAAGCALLRQQPEGHWERIAAAPGAAQPPPPTGMEQELIARSQQARSPIVADAGQTATGEEGRPDASSHLAVALRAGERVLGVLTFEATLPGAFGQAEVALAQLIAEYAAQVLARAELLEKIQQQNAALESTNRQLLIINEELEAFSYSVSHDLRAPLRGIAGFSQMLLEDYGDLLDERGKGYIAVLIEAGRDMDRLIDALLRLSRVTRMEMRPEPVDLSALARGVAAALARWEPEREVTVSVVEGLQAWADEQLLHTALENLLGNAWKFTRHTSGARIEVGATEHDGQRAYFIRDNGAGFDMAYAQHLFGAFRRLHSAREFEGTGIGLATVQRIINRHGGRVWAEGRVGHGASFYFTLPVTAHEERP